MLAGVHAYERQPAKRLALLFALVIGLATFPALAESVIKILLLQANWFEGNLFKILDRLFKILDRLLLIFSALEALQNIAADRRGQVVQIELILPTAPTAGAPKVIGLPPDTENKLQWMAGFGVLVVGIASAYWLVLAARRRQDPISHAHH